MSMKSYTAKNRTYEEAVKIRNKFRKSNYDKGNCSNGYKEWTARELELIINKPEGTTDRMLAKQFSRSVVAIQIKRTQIKREEELMKEKADAKRKQQQIAEEKANRVPQKGDKDYYSHKFPNGIFYPNGQRSVCGR